MTDQTTLKRNEPGDKPDPALGGEPQFDAVALFEQHKHSVVRIKNSASLGPNVIDNTLGTGFAIDRDDTESNTTCLLATDLHVVRGREPIKVENLFGNEYPATIQLSDEKNDLAILRVDLSKEQARECMPMAISSEPKPAQADEQILKITARDATPNPRVNKVESYFIRHEATGLQLLPGEDAHRSMLSLLGPGQTGDSGGPGINAEGKVVGIISAQGPGVTALTPSHYLVDDLKLARQKTTQGN